MVVVESHSSSATGEAGARRSALVSPPKPKVTFRVGVVGHRPNRLDQSKIGELQKTLHELLLVIRESTQCARHRTAAFCGEGDDQATLRIVSPLAEGSDRLMVEIALELGFELQCPMPFPRAEFENDFKPPQSLSPDSLDQFRELLEQAATGRRLVTFEMDGSRQDEAAAYRATGRVVLNQSDVLFAVWDGKPAAGVGGTVETLHEAVLYNVPVVWIDALEPERWQLLKTTKELERKELERDQAMRGHSENMKPESRCVPTPRPTDVADLRNEVQKVLHPQSSANVGSLAHLGPSKDQTTLEAYLQESRPSQNWGVLWKPFRDFFGDWKFKFQQLKIAPFEATIEDQWKKVEAKTGFGAWIDRQLLDYYAWSDKLADYYADAYRSSFIAAFLFGGFAVLFALLASPITRMNPASDEFRFWDSFFVALELATILFIFWVISHGRRKIWHGCWLNYRLVAELVRHIRFLMPLGGGRPFPRVSPHLGAYGNPEHTWMYWYVRAIERQVGLPPAVVDAKYLTGYTAFLAEMIDGQLDFHRTTERRSVNIDRRLKTASELLLVGTLVACILHFLLDMPLGLHGHFGFLRSPLIVCAAVFPAFGAALAAIRDQGEFHRLSMRCRAMVERLLKFKEELSEIQARTAANGSALPATSASLIEVAQGVIHLMVDEVLDWRIVFLDRPLETRA